MKRLISILVLSSAALLICGIGSLAMLVSTVEQRAEGRFIFGDNVTLNSGEEINEDMVVLGGNFNMAERSRINGDLAIFGGSVDSQGIIGGEVAVFGGNLNLGAQAEILGDVAVIGGNASIHEQALVQGRVHTAGGNANRVQAAPGSAEPDVQAAPFAQRFDDDDDEWRNDDLTDYRERGIVWGFFSFIGSVVQAIAVIVTLLAVSWVVSAFLPEQTKQVGDAAADNWLLCFGVGSATFLVSAFLVVLICLLFPFLVWFVVGIAALFGWIAIGQLVGERLLIAAERPVSNFTISTLTGVLVLGIIQQTPSVLGGVFCIGGLLSLSATLVTFFILATGLGAVILTRFGTLPYQQTLSYASTKFDDLRARATRNRPSTVNRESAKPSSADEVNLNKSGDTKSDDDEVKSA